MQFNIPAEHKNASGVYIIRNAVNEKVYVGSAVDFQKRYRAHSHLLKKGKHHSRSLQNFVNKHGFECLVFNLLEVTEASLAVACEQCWIDHFGSSTPELGFNIAPNAGSNLGLKHTAATKAKLSVALKGRHVSERTIALLIERNKTRIFSDEQRANLSISRRNPSQETRKKLSNAAKRQMEEGRSASFIAAAKNKSPETRALMSVAQKGREVTKERRQILREGAAKANSQRVHSEETRAKIADKAKGRIASEEARRKMSEAQLKRPPASAETRAKLSASLKGKPKSPETRQKLSEARKVTIAARRVVAQVELF